MGPYIWSETSRVKSFYVNVTSELVACVGKADNLGIFCMNESMYYG